MKAKKKAKPKTRTKTKAKTHAKKRTAQSRTPTPTANPYVSPDFKTCEELEVGDIGGFGITSEERMERETRCSQRAIQYCTSCARNLCNTHYELLHKDHDNPAGHGSGQNTVQA